MTSSETSTLCEFIVSLPPKWAQMMHLIAGINVRITQIMSLLLPRDVAAKSPEWATLVTTYCSDAFHALRGELPVPAESPLTPALLRVVPLLLARQPGLNCGALLKSFAALFEHCKPQSSCMRAALSLVAFLLSEDSKIDRAQVPVARTLSLFPPADALSRGSVDV